MARLGAMKGFTIRPARFGVAYDVAGLFQAASGAVFRARATVGVLNSAGLTQYIVGGNDGMVDCITTPPDPDNRVLLARIDPPGPRWTGGTHQSWLTRYPPVDDPDAQRRKAALDSGAVRIPGKDFPVGCRLDPADLAPFSSFPGWSATYGQAGGLRLARDGSVVQRATGPSLEYTQAAGTGRAGYSGHVVRDCLLIAPQQHRDTMDVRHNKATRGVQGGYMYGAASQQPSDLHIQDTTFRVAGSDPRAPWAMLPGQPPNASAMEYLQFPGRVQMERCAFYRGEVAIKSPGRGSRITDIVIRCVGPHPTSPGASYDDSDHGNGLYFQSWASMAFGGANKDEWGDIAVDGLHIMAPPRPDPRYDLSNTAALISFWNDADWVGTADAANRRRTSVQDVSISRALLDGGTVAIIAAAPAHWTGEMRDVTFRDIWVRRTQEYPGIDVSGILRWNKHDGARLPARAWLKRLRFIDCFDADTGERLSELEGEWNAGSDGVPVRTPP